MRPVEFVAGVNCGSSSQVRVKLPDSPHKPLVGVTAAAELEVFVDVV